VQRARARRVARRNLIANTAIARSSGWSTRRACGSSTSPSTVSVGSSGQPRVTGHRHDDHPRIRQGPGSGPHFVDQALEYAIVRPFAWSIGQASRILGADPRACGAATCCDNANFLVPPGNQAWTFGDSVYCRDVCSPATVRHENVHVQQWDRTGASFAIRYIYQAIVNGTHCDNPYERPAYQAGDGECSSS
jgi:hypothetical protein